LSILSAVLSALFLNDTVCLMLTPPVMVVLRRSGLPSAPYLIALAMSANIGSVMTEVGNPQNMLIASYSGHSYASFAASMAPVGAASLAVLVAMLLVAYGRRLRGATLDAQAISAAALNIDRPLLNKALLVLAGVMVAFVIVGDLPLVAMTGALALLTVSRRAPARVLGQVNWVLLTFFAGLFIVVHGLERTGLVAQLAASVRPMYGSSLATQIPVFSAVTVLASNIVSNVPFVVLAREIVPGLLEPELMWLMLAMASTLAGNLTIPGSVATLIVLETAGQHRLDGEPSVGFFEFLRLGIPVTVVTTALGAAILAAEHWLFVAAS
jgi:Na+/H+ antiporter NhaD/arsenite permease-like protein